MGDLLFESHNLAVDLVQSQVQRRLRIRPALACLEHWRAVAVEVQVDPAYRGREPTSLALFGELDLGFRDPSKVASETGQLALRHIAHLLPQTGGTVVQDDLPNSTIRRRAQD